MLRRSIVASYSHFVPYARHNRFYFGALTRTPKNDNKLPNYRRFDDYQKLWLNEENQSKHGSGVAPDKVIDLRDKKELELSESMRHPLEKDFYQDHTYHDQWTHRDFEPYQQMMLKQQYGFLVPGYERDPWVWYPGDVVEVVSGDFIGLRGQIISVIKFKNQISVQNVNVQEITLPATESRPEQIVQREHPISVDVVKHVDPTTNDVCDVRLVQVRNKETKKVEMKRISLSSGVLFPIPDTAPTQIDGDPMLDTPIVDADEETYVEEEERALLVSRKLKAMEDGFVKQLKESYQYHRTFSQKNYDALREYQSDVIAAAEQMLVRKMRTGGPLEDKMKMLHPLVAQTEDGAAEEEAANASVREGIEAQGGTGVTDPQAAERWNPKSWLSRANLLASAKGRFKDNHQRDEAEPAAYSLPISLRQEVPQGGVTSTVMLSVQDLFLDDEVSTAPASGAREDGATTDVLECPVVVSAEGDVISHTLRRVNRSTTAGIAAGGVAAMEGSSAVTTAMMEAAAAGGPRARSVSTSQMEETPVTLEKAAPFTEPVVPPASVLTRSVPARPEFEVSDLEKEDEINGPARRVSAAAAVPGTHRRWGHERTIEDIRRTMTTETKPVIDNEPTRPE